MSKSTIVTLVLTDLLMVALGMVKMWIYGATELNAYLVAAIVIFFGVPISLGLGFFVLRVLIFAKDIIARFFDR